MKNQTMSDTYCLVLCTCPEGDAVKNLANEIIAKRLAACVNILPGIVSVYPWKDQIETDREQLMLIKTRKILFDRLESFIKEHHPYELPEVIAVPIKAGSAEYFNWMNEWIDT